ncbi:hypothetical protein [Mesorhizobium sp. 43Arga]
MASTFWSAVVSGVVGIIVGIGGTVTTGAFGYLNKNRELDIEMVRVSLSILAGENKDTSLPGRQFALRALERYSGVQIPDADSRSGRNGALSLPSRPTLALYLPR